MCHADCPQSLDETDMWEDAWRSVHNTWSEMSYQDACDTAALQDDCVIDSKCSFTHVQASQASFSGQCLAQTFVAQSDKNLKMDMEKMSGEEANDILAALPAYRYKFKSDPVQQRFGTVAQDCLENVHTKDFVRADPQTGELSVCYQDIIMVLCASLKDCQERVAMLEADMAAQSD